LRDDKGSVAAIFGISSVALLLFVGVAVDYTRVSDADLKVQNAADSAVLAIAHHARRNSDPDDPNSSPLPTWRGCFRATMNSR
jgi:Flp pilus assembly protein TadG